MKNEEMGRRRSKEKDEIGRRRLMCEEGKRGEYNEECEKKKRVQTRVGRGRNRR